MKGQAEILGTVLVSAIVLFVVGSAFVWGRPLIDKSSDKSRLDTILLKLDEIDSAVKSVASTGSSKVIKINLHESDQMEITDKGEITLQTYMQVPLITSRDWSPLNAYELPEENQLFFLNPTDVLDQNQYPGLIASLTTLGTEIFNTSLGVDNWNVLVYRRQSDTYNYLCVVNGTSFVNEQDECGTQNEVIYTTGNNYTVIRINNTGSPVFISGSLVENVGLLARDAPGIILGRSRILGKREGLLTELKVQYRGLVDDKNIVHRINISCSGNCVVSSGVRDLRIVRSDIKRNPSAIDTYINIEFI